METARSRTACRAIVPHADEELPQAVQGALLPRTFSRGPDAKFRLMVLAGTDVIAPLRLQQAGVGPVFRPIFGGPGRTGGPGDGPEAVEGRLGGRESSPVVLELQQEHAVPGRQRLARAGPCEEAICAVEGRLQVAGIPIGRGEIRRGGPLGSLEEEGPDRPRERREGRIDLRLPAAAGSPGLAGSADRRPTDRRPRDRPGGRRP